MRRIQVTTTGMALRAVLTALAVYALVLQALFPLSAAVAAANGQTVSICVTTPDPTPAAHRATADPAPRAEGANEAASLQNATDADTLNALLRRGDTWLIS